MMFIASGVFVKLSMMMLVNSYFPLNNVFVDVIVFQYPWLLYLPVHVHLAYKILSEFLVQLGLSAV